MSRARRWRGVVPAGVLLAGLLLCPAPPARAHASLVRSAPAHRAVLGQMPERVQLWFNERLEPAYSTVSVWNEAGAQVDSGDVTVGPDDPRRLSVTVETRQSGLYTVKYRVLSVDGHIVDNRFTFTVRASR
ncbi:MAG TPA: copper resistance CopC family protein [Vicinamibacteria bacterium]|jgi:methionine-rich copper-binding protein CopC|nr:copper resistance CopC family protein [Vicinamibacteria bacterium]